MFADKYMCSGGWCLALCLVCLFVHSLSGISLWCRHGPTEMTAGKVRRESFHIYRNRKRHRQRQTETQTIHETLSVQFSVLLNCLPVGPKSKYASLFGQSVPGQCASIYAYLLLHLDNSCVVVKHLLSSKQNSVNEKPSHQHRPSQRARIIRSVVGTQVT